MYKEIIFQWLQFWYLNALYVRWGLIKPLKNVTTISLNIAWYNSITMVQSERIGGARLELSTLIWDFLHNLCLCFQYEFLLTFFDRRHTVISLEIWHCSTKLEILAHKRFCQSLNHYRVEKFFKMMLSAFID